MVRQIDDSNEITGGTDFTKIGNVGDRLKTDSILLPDSILTHHIDDHLVAEGSPLSDKSNLVVNGTGAGGGPYDFEFKPGSGSWSGLSGKWCILKLSIVLLATDDPDGTEFGGDSALTNGLEITYQQSGVSYNMRPTGNIVDNIDISSFFSDFNISGATDSKWLKDTGGRYYLGAKLINPRLVIDASQSDYFKVRVQDDLTSRKLSSLKIGVDAWKVV